MKRLEHKIERLRGEEGAALIIALMMLTLLTILGMAAVFMSNVDLNIAGNEKASIAGQYAAEAGIEDAINAMNTDPANPLPTEMTVIPNAGALDTGKAQVTIANKDKNYTVNGTVGAYTYTATISFKPNAGAKVAPYNVATIYPVTLYDQNFGYTSKAPKQNGYPVYQIHSVATGPNGYKSIVDLELSKFYIPVDGVIKGAVTANGNVTFGNGNGAGAWGGNYMYDAGGNLVPDNTSKDPVTGLTISLPGIDLPAGYTAPAAASGGNKQDIPAASGAGGIGTIEQALGFPDPGTGDTTGTDWLGSSSVNSYPPGSPTLPLSGINYIKGNFDCSGGKSAGSGILIVHNPLYIPRVWQVSIPGNPGYVGNDPNPAASSQYYDPKLDTGPHGAFDAVYKASCAPAQVNKMNGQSTFTGVVIADIIDLTGAKVAVVGAVIALDSTKTDMSVNGGGNGGLYYSSTEVSKACQGGKANIKQKLSWKKTAGYQ